MATTGADIGASAPGIATGYVVSVKPNVSANSITRKYIGGGVITRITGREFRVTVTGDISTSGGGTVDLSSEATQSVSVGSVQFSGCVVESYKIECSTGSTVTITTTFACKAVSEGAASVTTPAAGSVFFVMADGLATYGGDGTVTAASVEGSRTVTFVYAPGNLNPTDISCGPIESRVGVSTDSLSNILDVVNGASGSVSIEFSAVDEQGVPIGASYTLQGAGSAAREVSGSVDADSINVPVTYVG
jgi:hypothetical protein